MIKLDIEPYCQNCNEFAVECVDITPEYCVVKSFKIGCKYSSKCKHIKNYLQENVEVEK